MKSAAKAIKRKAQQKKDWPWSTDPNSPNRPPFKPQPPVRMDPDLSKPYPELRPRVPHRLTPKDGVPSDLDPAAKAWAEDYYRRRGKRPPSGGGGPFRPRTITSRDQRKGKFPT